jgi:hypothetical protein
MSEGRSAYARAADDWYVEPPWVSERLLDAERFDGGAHDPACGVGTIPGVLASRDLPASGADIVDRAQGRFEVRDFLIPIPSPAWSNVICNPPASKLVAFVEQALAQVEPGGLVAVLAPLKWAASQGRYALFSRPEMERIVVLSRRPLCPPGALLQAQGEGLRRCGSIDFAWYLWRGGKAHADARVGWLK